MYALVINAIVLMGTLASAQAAEVRDSQAVSGQPEPCYVVIAIDVSGGMESIDAPVSDSAGRRQTLRDEGQLVFLQLLPFLRSDLYVGVAHFSDRVRYELPRDETGPLLPWGQTYLSESACRNLVRPAEFRATFQSDIAESMTWALNRIQAARKQYGPGPGKVIILSNGNPYESARELSRGSGPVLSAARRLAEQQVQVYPIMINDASFRSAEGRGTLSSNDLAAEDLMQSAASMTGGKGYRLTPETGFADILMDVFGLGTPIGGELVVSPYDWAIVMVGATLEAVTVEPAPLTREDASGDSAPPGAAGTGPHVLAANGGLETAYGIRANIISSPRYRTMILRRPETRGLVDRSWQGRWKLTLRDEPAQTSVRAYRVPDFLMRLETVPQLPWWRHERVQLKAHLLDRHRRVADLQGGGPSDEGQGLSIHIRATAAEEANSFLLEKGQWVVPDRLYETGPFAVGVPGLYKLTCELRDSVAEVDVPVLRFASDVYVHSECIGLDLVNVTTDQVLQEVPPEAGPVQIDSRGGQQFYVRVRAKGEFKVEPLSGVLHLEPLPQTEWSLHKDDDGRLLTDRIDLVEREERLTGWAEVDVRTFVGVRHIQFPRFELSYAPAPLRVACAFADAREALWVGEYHRQPLNISAFPVFENFREKVLRLFPETLAEARIRTVDTRSGMTQVMGPGSRLLDPPQPGGYEGRTITATYFVESSLPIPPADRCEIDLSGTVENLQNAVKTYAIIDPAAQGLFRWAVQQDRAGQPRSAVAETLFCGEPVWFWAEWRADQKVSAVHFEIPQGQGAESVFVDMPVTAGSNKTQLEQVMPGLGSGQSLPVYVHITMQPAGADQPLQIKLRGGQFRTEDRRVVLEELIVGDGTPTDIPGYAWEPVELPLKAVFKGYLAGDPRHSAAIEQFKESCLVTVTPRTGDAVNITGTVEWSSVTADSATKTCELRGHATYAPALAGRATVELNAEAALSQTAARPSAQHAYAHVLVKEPRLAVAVHRLTPGGEEPVFDSRKWVRAGGEAAALQTRFSTRLRMNVQSIDPVGAEQHGPWKTTIRLLRRPVADAAWMAAFSEGQELAGNTSFMCEAQITENGEYALEIVGQDPQSGRRAVYCLTPVIASIQQHEVKPAAVPPAWLTARVRQWPFEYQVTLFQDTAGPRRPQSVAFQFQLPGQSDTWVEGATLAVRAESPDAQQLLARAPSFLPAVEALKDGTVQFRLSAQGLEFLRWEYPNVRVIPPVLEGLVLSRESGGRAVELNRAELASNGSSDLWVRPGFRAAPELEGRWTPAETIVYMWRDHERGPAGLQADVRTLEGLQKHGKAADGAGVQTFRIEGGAADDAVKVLTRRARWRFWGWPRARTRERYSLVASVAYRPKRASELSAGQPEALPVDRTVVEWSDIYAINLDAPRVLPFCWWPLVAVLLAAGVTAVLKLFVPSPSKLALDMRLEENIAIVDPVRLDNPVLVDLHETPLVREMQLYTRYLCGRWDLAGGGLAPQGGAKSGSVPGAALGALLRGVACVVGPVRVLLRRALYARRWAWAAILPRVRGDARRVRTGLLCVWTGLTTRRGRAWSSQSGLLELPQGGQTKFINLDLPYQVDGVDRTMRVTVRVRNTASEGKEATAPGWQETSSEFGS